MSKKSRRQRTPNLPPEAFGAPQATPAKGAPPATVAAAAAYSATQPSGVNWQADYGDVLGDLKRTAIIAAALLAGMIVLSFVIP